MMQNLFNMLFSLFSSLLSHFPFHFVHNHFLLNLILFLVINLLPCLLNQLYNHIRFIPINFSLILDFLNLLLFFLIFQKNMPRIRRFIYYQIMNLFLITNLPSYSNLLLFLSKLVLIFQLQSMSLKQFFPHIQRYFAIHMLFLIHLPPTIIINVIHRLSFLDRKLSELSFS